MERESYTQFAANRALILSLLPANTRGIYCNCAMSPATIRRHLRKLVEDGLVRVRKQTKGNSTKKVLVYSKTGKDVRGVDQRNQDKVSYAICKAAQNLTIFLFKDRYASNAR